MGHQIDNAGKWTVTTTDNVGEDDGVYEYLMKTFVEKSTIDKINVVTFGPALVCLGEKRNNEFCEGYFSNDGKHNTIEIETRAGVKRRILCFGPKTKTAVVKMLRKRFFTPTTESNFVNYGLWSLNYPGFELPDGL